MANSPANTPHSDKKIARNFNGLRLATLFVLLALLGLAAILSWTTRGAMSNFSFLSRGVVATSATHSLVDLRPWQTAEALAPLAVTAEENQFAREAEHNADHEVDQAFAAALRQAHLDAQHRTLDADAQALKQKIANINQLRKQDQAQVDKLTAAKSSTTADDDGDLQLAKAQLGLDTDELTDAQRDLDRASGDDTGRIQDELNAHEDSMRKYDSEVSHGQVAVISASQYQTLAAQIGAWFKQRKSNKLIQQAQAEAFDAVRTITAEHNKLEASVNASTDTHAEDSQLQSLQDRGTEREILSIDDDRIQTEQQLANVYAKWSAQVSLQHRIALHLILGSIMSIVLILIAMLLCDALVRRLMARLVHDRRQMRTLRSILQLFVQLIGLACILLVIFGAPRQTPTILGLTTAALTFALQDYIIAFLGWFTLMGKNGIHVGDWVEIDGVGGEVVDFRLMTTTLLETGGLADQGHPTGRRITLMNSYAIRGKFFNFSTAGQWMWDELNLSVPAGLDIHAVAQQIQKVAEAETQASARQAEYEWNQAAHDENATDFSAVPIVNLRPAGAGIDLQLRYVTAARDRFELRNRLYQRVVDLLHESKDAAKPADTH